MVEDLHYWSPSQAHSTEVDFLLRRGKELSLTTNDREDRQLFYISSFRNIIAMFSKRIEGRLVNVAYKLRGRDTQREGFTHKRTDLVPSLAPGLGYALA